MASRIDYNKKKQTQAAQFGAPTDNRLKVKADRIDTVYDGVKRKYSSLGADAIQIGTEGIASGIGYLKEMHDGMVLEETKQKAAAAIDSFMPNEQRDSIIEKQEGELAQERNIGDWYEEEAYRTLGGSTPDGIKITGTEAIASINLVRDNTKAKMDKMRLGHVQGKLSESQYQNKMNEIVKEAVSRHPSLQDEIISDMNYMHKISGVSDYTDQLKKQRDAVNADILYNQKKEAEQFLKREASLPRLKNGQTNWPIVFEKNQTYNRTVGSAQRAAADLQTYAKLEEAEKIEVRNKMLKKNEDGFSDLDNLTWLELEGINQKWGNLPDNIPLEEQGAVVANIEKEYGAALTQARLSASALAGDESVAKNLALFENQLTASKTATLAKINGTDKSKRLENSVKIINNADFRKFLVDTGIPQQRAVFMMTMFREFGGATEMLSGKNATDETRKIARKFFEFMSNNIAVVESTVLKKSNNDLSDKDNDIDAAVEGTKLIKQVLASGRGEEMFSENPDWKRDMTSQAVVDGLNSITANAEGFKNPTGVAFKNTEKLFDEYIAGDDPAFLSSLTNTAKGKVEDTARNWIKQIDDDINIELKNLSKQGIEIKTTINNGRLSFRSLSIDKFIDGSAAAADNMNAMYSERFQKFTKLISKLDNKNTGTGDESFLKDNIMESVPYLSSLTGLVKETPSSPSAPKEQTQGMKLPPTPTREQLLEALDKIDKMPYDPIPEGQVKKKDTSEDVITATSIYVKNNNKDLGYGVRNDPTQGHKGEGFAAGKHTVTMEDGEEVQVTEYTVGVTIDGKIVDVPSVNGYTTDLDMEAILESVRTGKPLPKEIEEKAKKHALDRIEAGKSIYLEDGEEQVPLTIERFEDAKDLTDEVENLKGANEQKQFISYIQKVENRKLMEGDVEEFRHPSPEGGLDTIGFGHKLTKEENKTGTVYGYNLSEINESTPPEKVLEIANDILQKDLAKHEQILIKTHGEKFTKLDRRRKQMLIDFQFNVRDFKHQDVFPNFKAALFAGDEKTMKKEYKRFFKSGDKWKSLGRNKDFKEAFIEKKI